MDIQPMTPSSPSPSTSSSVLQLPSFPFLTPTEFNAACLAFEERYRTRTRTRTRCLRHINGDGDGERDGESSALVRAAGWRDVRVYERDGRVGLVVLKSVTTTTTTEVDGGDEDERTTSTKWEGGVKEEEEDEIEDDDPEAFVRRPPAKQQLDVEYSILLSPTYRVPVLYFSLIDRSAGPIPAGDLDAVYDLLVPARFRAGLRDVGVLGGISVGNHPVSGIPTYFVHPCNTADALRDVANPKSMPDTNTYLLLWLGLVGGCVGLRVPKELVAGMMTEVESR